jgi:capsular exopolysaccharide synthesis family protein
VDNGFETVSLGDYVGVVWRRKWIVLLVTLLLAGAATLYAKHQQTLYSATATVIYNPQGATALQLQNNKSITNAAGTWATGSLDPASTTDFVGYVLGRFPVKGKTSAGVRAQTTTVVTPSGGGLSFTVADPSSRTAMVLANNLAQGFPMYLDNLQLQGQIATETKLITADTAIIRNPAGYNFVLKNKDGSIQTKNGKPVPDTARINGKTNDRLTKQTKLNSLKTQVKSLNSQTSDINQHTVTQLSAGATQTQPQVAKTVAIGAFIGLVLGMFLAFLQDVLDTRIRDAEDVGRRLRLPLLARIPSPPKAVGNGLVALADPAPPLVPSSEAYRIAKLNLASVLNRNPDIRTIMFTSAGDDEGTSQTTANLAIVLARSGKHVILVDANLRSPVQGEFFGLDDRAGLSDVLAGRARLADALTGVDVGRHGAVDAAANGRGVVDGILEVLPAGAATVDAAELLDSRTATELVLTLRSRADIVLIDAPAMLPVTDAMVLASKVDGVIVVSRARLASRPTVVALRRALDNCPAPGVGFVFTGASSGARNDYGGSYVVPRPAPGFGEDEREPREVGVL